MERCEVVVVGGGLIGCAVARELAREGRGVHLFERGAIGGEASGAAAGMLGVQGETEDETMLRLGARSRGLYPGVLADLRAETGLAVEFRRHGTLYLCFDEADRQILEARREWQRTAGFDSDLLSGPQVLAREPQVSRGVRCAALFAGDGHVDNRRLTDAYARAAAAAGCVLHEGEAVRGVAIEGGAVVGVRGERRRIACDAVVNTAGAWAAGLAAATPVPTVPVRGQIVVVRAPREPFRHALYARRGYAVARRDGRVLLGSTRERAGYEKRVTAGGVSRILEATTGFCPLFRSLPVVETWSGLRPGTPDGRPIIGRDPQLEGYFVATGHFRNGVLLAPLTAVLVGRLLRGGNDPDLAPLALERFREAQTAPVG